MLAVSVAMSNFFFARGGRPLLLRFLDLRRAPCFLVALPAALAMMMHHHACG
jgi:hypothetical protein